MSKAERLLAGSGSRIIGIGRRILEGDLFYSFKRSPMVIIAFMVSVLFLIAALFAPFLAPHNTYDVSTLHLRDAFLPPAWFENGYSRFVLGTDDQGRDILSAIIFGLRISLLVGFASVALAAIFGTFLGLASGYVGGWLDSILMRIADIQLSFPTILIALLINGIVRSVISPAVYKEEAIYVLILAISGSLWVNFARTVRGSTMVEKNKEYVQAARVVGVPRAQIMLRHVLPNTLGPVLVIVTLSLATSILTEATLSFLGIGVPVTQPSLGTLVRIGNDFIFSGEWWIALWPGLALTLLVFAVNIVGDWLRDALNPKLR